MALRTVMLSANFVHGSGCGLTVVYFSILAFVFSRSALVRLLPGRCLNVALAHSHPICSGGLGGKATLAVKTGPAAIAVRYGIVYVSIVYYRGVYVYYSSIILVPATLPPATVKAAAAVTVSVIYTAVKAYALAPISAVPSVIAAVIAPISGRP